MQGQNSHFKNLFYLLVIFFVCSSGIYFFSFITADPDLWGHIKFGEYLWHVKSLPKVDIYSFTAYGRTWINHEWLSELIMYGIFNLFGSAGLLIGKLLLGLVIIYFLSRISLYRRPHPLIYGIVIVTAIFIMSPGFMIRPQLATFLYTTVFFYIFHLYLERKINILWLLPVTMVFWVNSHGGFLIGIGMFALVTVSDFISCHVKGVRPDHLKSMIFWMAVTYIAAFLNPYGIRLFYFLFKTLSMPRKISEWSGITVFDLSYIRLKVFSLLVLFSLFIDRKGNRYWEISIILVAMIYAFLHQRNTVIFGIFAAPFLIEKLNIFFKKTGTSGYLESIKGNPLIIAAISIIILFQVYYSAGLYIRNRFNIIVDPNIYPVYAVNFLKKNDINGNILLPFEWGEYVIWKLSPESKVSIDGRFRTVYPENVINAHFEGTRSEEGWNSLLNKYPSDIVLARRNPFSQKMITDPSSDWVYIYSDNISIIFVKKGKFSKKVIRKLRHKKSFSSANGASLYFP